MRFSAPPDTTPAVVEEEGKGGASEFGFYSSWKKDGKTLSHCYEPSFNKYGREYFKQKSCLKNETGERHSPTGERKTRGKTKREKEKRKNPSPGIQLSCSLFTSHRISSVSSDLCRREQRIITNFRESVVRSAFPLSEIEPRDRRRAVLKSPFQRQFSFFVSSFLTV
jgi:hypothetical protein